MRKSGESDVSCSWNLENDTSHGQKRSTTPRQTAGRPIRYAHGKLKSKVPRHARHPRSILARMSLVSGVSARMSRGCYEETAAIDFKL